MRPRISIRGCVRWSVCPSVRQSRVIFERQKSRFLRLERLQMTSNNNNNNNDDDNNDKWEPTKWSHLMYPHGTCSFAKARDILTFGFATLTSPFFFRKCPRRPNILPCKLVHGFWFFLPYLHIAGSTLGPNNFLLFHQYVELHFCLIHGIFTNAPDINTQA